VNNNSTAVINTGSTAHSPAMPAGMGIGSRG